MLKLGTRLAPAIAALALAACTTTAEPLHESPWPGLDGGSSYYLGEGGQITISDGDGHVQRVYVRQGQLYLTYGVGLLEDLGACGPNEPVRFHHDGRLTVSGETRTYAHQP